MWSILKSKQKYIMADPIFQEAVDFKKAFDYDDVKSVENADWIFDHAKSQFDLMETHVRYLDDKADAFIRYFGIIVAGVGVFLGVCEWNFEVGAIWLFLGGLLLLITSVLAALWVRIPFNRPYPPSVKAVFTSVKKTDSRMAAQARVALTYERAIAGNMVVGRAKGRRLRLANILVVIGLVTLLAGFGFQTCSVLISEGGSFCSSIQRSSSSSSSLSPLPLPLDGPDSLSSQEEDD